MPYRGEGKIKETNNHKQGRSGSGTKKIKGPAYGGRRGGK
jgi:hypothetical protein